MNGEYSIFWIIGFMIVFALLLSFVCTKIIIDGRKKALKMFRMANPDEEILLSSCTNSFLINIVFAFIILPYCVFFLPSLFFENLPKSIQCSQTLLLIWTLIFGSILFFIFRLAIPCTLYTENRIMILFPNKKYNSADLEKGGLFYDRFSSVEFLLELADIRLINFMKMRIKKQNGYYMEILTPKILKEQLADILTRKGIEVK